ncbi:MAG TPA: hypothetical protein VL171_00830 [Verrucomicrobiae bacterium]|nr:hypothetical protein [Verrucomicrobiae bacterium]
MHEQASETLTIKTRKGEKKLTRRQVIDMLNQRTRKLRRQDRADGPTEESFRDHQRNILLRYPRLVAHLICHSLGYFCPRSAANAILFYKEAKPFWCEWYCHMAECTLRSWDERVRQGYEKRQKPADESGMLILIGADALNGAVRNRRTHQGYMAEYLQGRVVILRELNGNGPILASWF